VVDFLVVANAYNRCPRSSVSDIGNAVAFRWDSPVIGPMKSIWVFDVVDVDAWRAEATAALTVLRELDGFESGEVVRNIDEHLVCAVVTTWTDAGSLRRGLGSMRSKIEVWPFLATMRDQASVFETLDSITPSASVSFESSVHA
jgi:hypothetical protein